MCFFRNSECHRRKSFVHHAIYQASICTSYVDHRILLEAVHFHQPCSQIGVIVNKDSSNLFGMLSKLYFELLNRLWILLLDVHFPTIRCCDKNLPSWWNVASFHGNKMQSRTLGNVDGLCKCLKKTNNSVLRCDWNSLSYELCNFNLKQSSLNSQNFQLSASCEIKAKRCLLAMS